MPLKFTTSYVEDSLSLMAHYRKMGERAIAQVSDADLFTTIDEESNSIGIIVKHLAGNMKSRWVNFLTSDGEKAGRNRDSEFENDPMTREALMDRWNEGWGYVFAAMEPLTDADLGLTITIRLEPHSVMQAIGRQLAHYAYHVGQIVMLAKHFQGAAWSTLSVPRGKSEEFNQRVTAGELSQR